MAKTYTYFWHVTHIHGWASQWFPSPITVALPLNPQSEPSKRETVTLPTAEHWMMLQKALLFNDADVVRKVLAIPGSASHDLGAIKALGRAVRGFDQSTWAEHRERIVYEGNLEKFRQNRDLWAKLDATGDSVIAEASPRDTIWGIGIGEKRAVAEGENSWRGKNLLGYALMKVRAKLREEAQEGREQKVETEGVPSAAL
jgi:ribA/ribD-fused uncharacterized protein